MPQNDRKMQCLSGYSCLGIYYNVLSYTSKFKCCYNIKFIDFGNYMNLSVYMIDYYLNFGKYEFFLLYLKKENHLTCLELFLAQNHAL